MTEAVAWATNSGAPPSGSFTSEGFDDLVDDGLVDDATHIVNNLIHDHVLAGMTDGDRSKMLVEIADALTAVLDQYVPKDLGCV